MADLDRRAAEHGPSTTVCYPLAGTGERFPFAVDDATEFWITPPADDVDAYRAVLEGVAFVERLAFERLGDLGAPLDGPLRAAGAGSASDVWTAIRATVLGVPIVRAESADTAFGACLLAAAGTLHETLRAATDAMVHAGAAEVRPTAGERDHLEAGYQRFVAALAVLLGRIRDGRCHARIPVAAATRPFGRRALPAACRHAWRAPGRRRARCGSSRGSGT